MKINKLTEAKELELIADYVPEQILNLAFLPEIMVLAAYAEEEEELLTNETAGFTEAAEDETSSSSGEEDEDERYEREFDETKDRFTDRDGISAETIAEALLPEGEDEALPEEAVPFEEARGIEQETEALEQETEERELKSRRKINAGEFLGFAMLSLHKDVAEVMWLYVLPDCRTLGAGSELLNEAVEYALENGLHQLTLLKPDKVSFPAQKDEVRDLRQTERFLSDSALVPNRKLSFRKWILEEMKIGDHLLKKQGGIPLSFLSDDTKTGIVGDVDSVQCLRYLVELG